MKIDLLALLESSHLRELFAAIVGSESKFEFGSANVENNSHAKLTLTILSNVVGERNVWKWVNMKDPNNCRNELVQYKEVREKGLKIRIAITEKGLIEVSCEDDSLATSYPIDNVFEVVKILDKFKSK